MGNRVNGMHLGTALIGISTLCCQSALAQNPPVSATVGEMRAYINEIDVTMDFELKRWTQDGQFTHYTFEGTGWDMSNENGPQCPHISVTFRFTAGNPGLTTDPLGSGLYELEAGSGKKWILREEDNGEEDNSYAVVDPDAKKTVLQVTPRNGWSLDKEDIPSVAQMIYLFVVQDDPAPRIPIPCNPSFDECIATAKEACAPYNTRASSSCDAETGAVSCSWTCFAEPCPEE